VGQRWVSMLPTSPQRVYTFARVSLWCNVQRNFADIELLWLIPVATRVADSLLATLAKQERVRLSERVTAGLARARMEDRIGGRPKLVVSVSKTHKLAAQGRSDVQIGARLGCSRVTVARRLADG